MSLIICAGVKCFQLIAASHLSGFRRNILVNALHNGSVVLTVFLLIY